MREWLELIDEVLTERGWSARQASIEATGAPHLISRMRRGQEPSASRLRALCEVLGLEFFVGRRRSVGDVALDVARLARALEAVAAAYPDLEESVPLHDRAQLIAAVYGVLDDRDVDASAARVRDLIEMAKRFGVADAVRE